jgi:ABC-type lipoprotein export system ATPase subunit
VRHLVQLSVRGLLGRFNHDLAFPEEWEFVILHGPNGVGKTRLLELVNAVASDELHRLVDYPFDSAEFAFSDGSVIQLGHPDQMPLEDQREVKVPRSLKVLLACPGMEPEEFTVEGPALSPEDIPNARLRNLERELPLERVDVDDWYDFSTDSHLTLQGIVSRYRHTPAAQSLDVTAPPPAFTEFVSDFHVHLIETQRLIRLIPAAQRRNVREHEQSTVLRYARDLIQRLEDSLAENSRTSQQLDRTFPNRILGQKPPAGITDEQIRERYRVQSELREKLAEISVLEPGAPDISLPDRDLDDWERWVLWTYLDDTDQKLATFRGLLDRVQLLRRIVNSRFLYKELAIDAEQGFKFVVADTGQEIRADSLSSGEQHELVLVYDLLFNVPSESTVLIDEPELSLHVSWQQQFLNDIVQIAELASLRFIIATHSPQIVHTWTERMVPLRLPKGLARGE